jgi:hypothetical protein
LSRLLLKDDKKPSNWQNRVSPHLVENVNFFGSKGGFNAILARIKFASKKVDVDTLTHLLKPIAQVGLLAFVGDDLV